MSRLNRSVRVGKDRASLYTEITDKIIAELEAGRVPTVIDDPLLAAHALSEFMSAKRRNWIKLGLDLRHW